MTYVLSLARRRLAVPCKLALAFSFTFLADWLLFGWDPGVSVVLFFLALAACAIIVNPVHASSRQVYFACMVFGLSLLPLVEGLNVVSLLFGVAGSLFFIVVISGIWKCAREQVGRCLSRGAAQLAWMELCR